MRAFDLVVTLTSRDGRLDRKLVSLEVADQHPLQALLHRHRADGCLQHHVELVVGDRPHRPGDLRHGPAQEARNLLPRDMACSAACAAFIA